jgi:hypothetical protein
MPSMQTIKRLGAQTFGAIGLLALLAAGIYVSTSRIISPPGNAKIIVDDEKRTYASIPCVVYGDLEREVIENRGDAHDPSKALALKPYAKETTLEKVRGLKMSRDEKCQDADGFDQHEHWYHRLFGRRSRWTKEGEWHW